MIEPIKRQPPARPGTPPTEFPAAQIAGLSSCMVQCRVPCSLRSALATVGPLKCGIRRYARLHQDISASKRLGGKDNSAQSLVPEPDRKSTRLNSSHLGISY